MNKLLPLRITNHNMQRTRCLNIYLKVFKSFQLGLYREYSGSLEGGFYVGTNVTLYFPFSPFRTRFFIPSVYTVSNCLSYFRSINKYAFMPKRSLWERIQFTRQRLNYISKN